MSGERVLIIEDEASVRFAIAEILRAEGYAVVEAEDGPSGIERFRAGGPFSAVLLDLKLPGLPGEEVLDRILDADPDAAVIVVTAFGTRERAIELTRRGAYDLFAKPFRADELLLVVGRAVEKRSLRAEIRALREAALGGEGIPGLIGSGRAMRQVCDVIRAVAPKDINVLITGETGTGKEVVARAIHALSPRAAAPFVALNCGAIPRELQESELFGFERGAFTGAVAARKGTFELAQGGTLLLDEIGDMAPSAQTNLLRVLDRREVQRVGGSRTNPVDVRVLAATNRDLAAGVRDGAFREDLYWRLEVVRIELPPLRERREDIPVLVEHFLEHFRKAFGSPVRTVSERAMEALVAHPWPGNVRELENAIRRAVALAEGEVLTADAFPARVLQPAREGDREGRDAPDPTLPEAVEQATARVEVELIRRALRCCEGNKKAAAERLGISRKALYEKLRKYGLGGASSYRDRRKGAPARREACELDGAR